MRLQRVPVRDLPGLADRALHDRARFPVLPITPSRAESQARNPAAAPEDVGLIVAWHDDRCIGYLGLFPVWLEDDDRRHKVFNLSTYFVGPEHRGSGAGTLLLLDALSVGRDLFVAGVSPAANRVFLAAGFRPARPVVVLDVRLEAAMGLPSVLHRLRNAPPGAPSGRWTHGLDRIRRLSRLTLERALRPLVVRLLAPRARPVTLAAAVESVRTPASLKPRHRTPGELRFVRDDAAVNWMIHAPWIVDRAKAPLDYAFSYRRCLFRFLPFQLHAIQGGADLGFVVLRVSGDADGTVLRILDCVLADESLRADVLLLALKQALRWSADRLECGEDFEPLLRSSFLRRVLTRRGNRTCLAFTRDRGGPFGKGLERLVPGVCDGDMPFA